MILDSDWEVGVGVVKQSHRKHRDRQTEKAITEATLIPWIARLSGPIHEKIRVSYFYYYYCYYYYYY